QVFLFFSLIKIYFSLISFRRNSVYFQVNSYFIPIEFDSTKIESNSTRVEFDSIAPKQGLLRLRLDFYFLILTGSKNTNKIYILFYLIRIFLDIIFKTKGREEILAL
ncbi:MAG: hypothetical protein WC984_03385, partial [Bacteroidales bacterium]